MTKMKSPQDFAFSRRDMMRGAGALVVTAAGAGVGGRKAKAALGSKVKPALHPTELDSFIHVGADGRVTAFFGKMDMGQGVDVAISQIVADELDVAYEKVTTLLSDTGTSVNQGGASGSFAIKLGGVTMRHVAAEARRLLVEEAARRLGVKPMALRVDDGVVSVKGSPRKKIAYAEILQGQYFNHKLKWNKKLGNRLFSSGAAKPKSYKEYKVVGKPFPRVDVAGKVYGTTDFVTDIKVPGMVHGRVIHPEKAGAKVKSVDASSIKHIKGAQVVHMKDFLAVVANTEWDVVQAARDLKVTWTDSPKPFSKQQDLYTHIRKAPVVKKKIDTNEGDVDGAFKNAAKVIEAEFEFPFQSHASMGPACAVVDTTSNPVMLWTGSQKAHYTAEGVERILKLKPGSVRGVWVPGPGSYGRNDAGDAAMQAAVLSKAVGKPVRVQGMRHEGTAWDPKNPASVHRCRAALDAMGNVLAYEFMSKAFDRQDVRSNESKPADNLAGQALGVKLKPRTFFRSPEDIYTMPARRLGWEVIPPFLDRYSPLRTSHLRDPIGPQIHFASDQFHDMLAEEAGLDPVDYRLKYLKSKRDRDLVEAAAKQAGWQKRVGPNKGQSGDIVRGRGIGYAFRSGCRVAVVADIEVNKKTGKVWGKKFTVAHDCGLIINPDGLTRTIHGNIGMALSRILYEEVNFDEESVTSVDWVSYPIVESPDAPESIDVVLINKPDQPAQGAGEGSTRPVSGAVANAFYDATGVRMMQAPLSPEKVKAALAKAKA